MALRNKLVVRDQATKVGLKESGDFASWIDQAPLVIVATATADAGALDDYVFNGRWI